MEEATIRDDFDEMQQLTGTDTASSDADSSDLEAVALTRLADVVDSYYGWLPRRDRGVTSLLHRARPSLHSRSPPAPFSASVRIRKIKAFDSDEEDTSHVLQLQLTANDLSRVASYDGVTEESDEGVKFLTLTIACNTSVERDFWVSHFQAALDAMAEREK